MNTLLKIQYLLLSPCLQQQRGGADGVHVSDNVSDEDVYFLNLH